MSFLHIFQYSILLSKLYIFLLRSVYLFHAITCSVIGKKSFRLVSTKDYTKINLRYSQNAPLNMYDEVNTKCNLPAQIDIEATEGMEYKFLCVTKGGGSANKTLPVSGNKSNPESRHSGSFPR